jgi:hypothetical protein
MVDKYRVCNGATRVPLALSLSMGLTKRNIAEEKKIIYPEDTRGIRDG